MKNLMLSTLTLCLTLVGCGHDHDDHDHGSHSEVSANEEACLHAKNGPATELAGSNDKEMPTDTEHTDWEHKRVDLTLVADEAKTSFMGYVTFEAETEGDYLFFVAGDTVVTVNGEKPEKSEDVAECTELTKAYTFELPVGEHVVEVSAKSEMTSLVVEATSHEGHDGDDH